MKLMITFDVVVRDMTHSHALYMINLYVLTYAHKNPKIILVHFSVPPNGRR